MNLPPGTKLVSSWTRERQFTRAEIKQLPHLDQLTYLITHGAPSNEQMQADLEREDQVERLQLHGELIVGTRYYDDGPGDYLD